MKPGIKIQLFVLAAFFTALAINILLLVITADFEAEAEPAVQTQPISVPVSEQESYSAFSVPLNGANATPVPSLVVPAATPVTPGGEKPTLPVLPADEIQKPAMDISNTSVYYYTFNSPGILYETGKMDESRSVYWWLNSGAQMIIENGIGKTLHGDLPVDYNWRVYYENDNPVDTDSGYRPQNIFRLLTRKKWENFQEEMFFRIDADNLSQSPNRDGHNGLLLMLRFKDGDNLYYAGLRTDGRAIIKKKKNGEYHVLAYEPIFSGVFNRETNPSLLPKNQWIGIRSQIITGTGNTVNIKLFIKLEQDKDWRKILEAKDDAKTYGGSAILGEGYAGARTDFMDVSFKDFKIKEL